MISKIENEFALKLSDRCRDLSLVGFGFITWTNEANVSAIHIPYMYCLFFLLALMLDILYWIIGALKAYLETSSYGSEAVMRVTFFSKVTSAAFGWFLSFIHVVNETIRNFPS